MHAKENLWRKITHTQRDRYIVQGNPHESEHFALEEYCCANKNVPCGERLHTLKRNRYIVQGNPYESEHLALEEYCGANKNMPCEERIHTLKGIDT